RAHTRQLKIPHAQSSSVRDDIERAYSRKNDPVSSQDKSLKPSMRRVTKLLQTVVTPSRAKIAATSQRPPWTSPFVMPSRWPLAVIRSTLAGTIRYCLVSQPRPGIGCGIRREGLYRYAAHALCIVPQSHSREQVKQVQQIPRPALPVRQTAQPPQNLPRPQHQSKSRPRARRAQNTPQPPKPRGRHRSHRAPNAPRAPPPAPPDNQSTVSRQPNQSPAAIQSPSHEWPSRIR